MQVKKVKISEIKTNPKNPRLIKNDKFRKLVKSIKEFPQMLELRPIVVDENNIVLGGNMRLKACIEVGLKEIYIVQAAELTEDQKDEFIVKDNVGFGEWDWDLLANEWNTEKLDEWGLDLPVNSATEDLSNVQFEDVYYIPEEKPNISLIDCVDLTKFNQKIKLINDSKLNEEQKNILTLFAYRFIKIDFENVANYYFFNANEDEKNVIERLRLVLCDNGINGFIEDDLLRVHNLINGWND
jgi:hypothetical protein